MRVSGKHFERHFKEAERRARRAVALQIAGVLLMAGFAGGVYWSLQQEQVKTPPALPPIPPIVVVNPPPTPPTVSPSTSKPSEEPKSFQTATLIKDRPAAALPLKGPSAPPGVKLDSGADGQLTSGEAGDCLENDPTKCGTEPGPRGPSSGPISAVVYGSGVQKVLQEALGRDEMTRYGAYNVRIKLWIGEKGQAENCRLVDRTGDETLNAAFCRIARQSRYAAPPENLRGQVLNMRLAGRPIAG
jgi:outer membrane biosynthesis protein TonB